MTSGRPFSEREQAHILRFAYTRTWGAIARDLCTRFPEDNGGNRSGYGVRNWVRAQEHAAGLVTVRTRVPADVAARLRTAGLSPVEAGALLAAGLKGRA